MSVLSSHKDASSSTQKILWIWCQYELRGRCSVRYTYFNYTEDFCSPHEQGKALSDRSCCCMSEGQEDWTPRTLKLLGNEEQSTIMTMEMMLHNESTLCAKPGRFLTEPNLENVHMVWMILRMTLVVLLWSTCSKVLLKKRSNNLTIFNIKCKRIKWSSPPKDILEYITTISTACSKTLLREKDSCIYCRISWKR